ncbi:thiamine diphosphokinase [Lacimonas salitolerans]|uniref:Thiamine diphosphokinase n=2 Tax=Lacimonas salitolerans TaxID=1323750 RepID=A0ABW4EAG6_9RHOB
MTAKIVQSNAPVMLLGGGEADLAMLQDLRRHAPQVVAADGGAALALAAGMMPLAVIGDMDSLGADDLARIDPALVHKVTEQDSTDFEKALSRIDAPLVLGLGFLGARRDHELANYNTLVRHAHRACILAGGDEIVLQAPPDLRLDLDPGARVSLFPLRAVTGRSTGLRWPIDGIGFAPDGRIGTSNAATGPVHLQFDAPGMLLILPRSAMPQVVQAVLARRGWWPAL